MDKLNLKKSEEMWQEALDLVPGGVLGIRRPYNFIPGEYPLFLTRGKAGHVWDVDGNEYIDLLCAYGPIILGYCEQEIDEAVKEQMKHGFCFNLCQPWQNKLAKKLRELIPCSEQSFFVKTGSDATSAAIRIARGFTKREKILRCGYHGWHDWCSEVHGGIPEDVYSKTIEFEYNDVESLERLLAANKGEVAAIIITPVGHPLAKPLTPPAPGFLEGVRKLADDSGAVLIFDEIRTGFRVSLGGAGVRYGVLPDMALFGKAMANGYPIAAVCGKKSVMKVLTDAEVFISSTFFPNSLEMIAALKTIEILEREKVCDVIWERGEKLLREMKEVAKESKLPVTISGIPPMPYITFDAAPDKKYKERRKVFYTGAIRRGLFMQPYHHSYIAYRHTEEDLRRIVEITRESLADVLKTVG
ncbi:MAG TPA: aminotransferase class III-fold pyridoxal phosphate-dependent enzyme [bacterium]|jgi:glutamate-1-semialdehyde aminotransferase|nr:MAG: 3-aminobutyryl-CoA aminotransferase [bacterium ADurb.Bin270]HPW45832.1 aminotransferase class III-fold pyridoxal phosphate-dependent enzyme [bacterium]HQG12788.1 aminotransferase class III-fold pyridoxal phosphate-dependent enzyme [bacterium]HQH80356.1 aminotransferase class III-fold pyridoxal phosphate-dependent enzyme [bacterium]